MAKNNSRRNQKLYKMKGCSKTRKNHLGGKKSSSKSFFSYNGKGGACSASLAPSTSSYQNINGGNPAYPSTGPNPSGFNFLNPQGTQRGGGCGCGMPLMSGGRKRGGSCGPNCMAGWMGGAKHKHRVGCKCSVCKMKGGAGNNGIPYPDGLAGKPWTPAISGWPGVDGINGDRNYLAYNDFKVDPQTAAIYSGANAPFSIGGSTTRKRRQKGGVMSNSIGQDLVNVGRQFQYGLGTAYNALAGYQAPVNPMPWKGQLPTTANLSTVRAAYAY